MLVPLSKIVGRKQQTYESLCLAADLLLLSGNASDASDADSSQSEDICPLHAG
jgi:hypothetical protein